MRIRMLTDVRVDPRDFGEEGGPMEIWAKGSEHEVPTKAIAWVHGFIAANQAEPVGKLPPAPLRIK